MENQGKDEAIQSLEKFRTDQSIKPNATDNQPFAENNMERKKRWFKRLSISAVFILIFSLSITVYANYDQMVGSKKENTADQQAKTKTPSKKRLKTTQQETPAGEAFHLEFEKKMVERTPKKKISTKRQTPSASTRLSPPPQPKKQEKPALNDKPIQLPEDYKQRLQKNRVESDGAKKKK